MTDFEQVWQKRLDELVARQRLRRLRSTRPAGPGRIELDGRVLDDFSANDYLGLAQHPELARRAAAWIERWGCGSGASRLVRGNLAPFAEIEAKLAVAKGCEAALVFTSGFQANATVLPALLDRHDHDGTPLVFADTLIHASLHHGCRAAGLRPSLFRHNDLDHLEALLRAAAAQPGPRFIVTETVFSMDGDRADVAALLELAERWGAFLYLDEAHATGVLGANGFGLAAGLGGRVGLVMGTFSKALGGFGAYIACSARLRDYLINRCAGLIYSTGLPPAVLAAMDAALDLVPKMAPERAALQAAAERVRIAFAAAGLDTGASSTQIVPAILGDEARALGLARALEADGILAVAIRPPTVPPGTSRIRFALSAAHSAAQIDHLIAAVALHADR